MMQDSLRNIFYLPHTQNAKVKSWHVIQIKLALLQIPNHVHGVTNYLPACLAGIIRVHLILLFLYVLLHVSPIWYYLLQTVSYLRAASTAFYNKPRRALNEPITRVSGKRGEKRLLWGPFCLSPFEFIRWIKQLRGEFKWAFAGPHTLNRAGVFCLGKESVAWREPWGLQRASIEDSFDSPRKASRWVHPMVWKDELLPSHQHKHGQITLSRLWHNPESWRTESSPISTAGYA